MGPYRNFLGIFIAAGFVLAKVTTYDPSDVINPKPWAADNALLADYNVPYLPLQPSDILAVHSYSSENVTIDHVELLADANDTSVVLLAGAGGSLKASHVDILKTGYSTNLNTASFWGFNAAVNIANGSVADLDHVNITVHNGAANVYAYGTGTVVTVTDSFLYSSGPVSHGLYASGNATTIGRNLRHFSGGYRSSSFSGDGPGGYVEVYDSVARVTGIGSATYYALGVIYAENVLSVSEQGPVLFMDGNQTATLIRCDATAGLLGGVVVFSSMNRQSGAKLAFQDSKITTLGHDMPGLWFGNTIVNVTINNTEIVAPSGVLIVANYSQVTQDFNRYASYVDNNQLLPAEVYATVYESDLKGDLVPYNGSYIFFKLDAHSTWTGSAHAGYGVGLVDISLNGNSTWTLTGKSTVQKLTIAEGTIFSRILSAGHDLHYNSSLNPWLSGATVALTGGGVLIPM